MFCTLGGVIVCAGLVAAKADVAPVRNSSVE